MMLGKRFLYLQQEKSLVLLFFHFFCLAQLFLFLLVRNYGGCGWLGALSGALPLFVGIHVYSIGWMSYIRPTKEQNNHNIKLNKGVREVWIW